MSRADAFAAFYRETYSRVLHQLYAVTGNVELSHQAVGDGFVAAAHHWRKVRVDPDREAWIRQRSLHAAGRRRRDAGATYDDRTPAASRELFEALRPLSAGDRHLLVAHLVVGLDLSAAAREVGVTDEAARRSLDHAAVVLRAAGIDLEHKSLAARLDDLHTDVRDVPANRAGRLRREGNRRRRSHLALAGVAALALTIGAGALTAAKPEASAMVESLPGTTTPPPVERSPTFQQPDFTSSQLTSLDEVSRLDPKARWRIAETSDDFEPTKPIHRCLTAIPADPRADHLWLREHVTGRAAQPTSVVETLEVSATADHAEKSYDRVVQALATCPRGGFEVTKYADVTEAGGDATLIRLTHVARKGVSADQVAVVRTGRAVVTWLVQASDKHPVSDSSLVALLSSSVNQICGYADGACAFDARSVSATPPAAQGSRGLLGPADLPVMIGVPDPWVATDPERTRSNPAGTECDRADFVGSGAKDVRTRSYVVPTADKLPTLFGMTQVVGTFKDPAQAREFMRDVERDVRTCNDRQPSVEMKSSDDIPVQRGAGAVWEIQVGTSEQRAITFRVALVRVGTSVSQLTFTPVDRFDLSAREYAALAQRTADRLRQF